MVGARSPDSWVPIPDWALQWGGMLDKLLPLSLLHLPCPIPQGRAWPQMGGQTAHNRSSSNASGLRASPAPTDPQPLRASLTAASRAPLPLPQGHREASCRKKQESSRIAGQAAGGTARRERLLSSAKGNKEPHHFAWAASVRWTLGQEPRIIRPSMPGPRMALPHPSSWALMLSSMLWQRVVAEGCH